MLPQKSLNIYPKTDENLLALISFYFNDYDIQVEGGLELLKEINYLSLNQCEYILKLVSSAFNPVFKKHLSGRITLTNLIQYGIDALKEDKTAINGSKSRIMITNELIDFINKNNQHL